MFHHVVRLTWISTCSCRGLSMKQPKQHFPMVPKEVCSNPSHKALSSIRARRRRRRRAPWRTPERGRRVRARYVVGGADHNNLEAQASSCPCLCPCPSLRPHLCPRPRPCLRPCLCPVSSSASVSVCLCVYLYICICVTVCICIFVCICVCISLCVSVYIS